MPRHRPSCLKQIVCLAVVLASTLLPAAAHDLLGRLNDRGAPGPVTSSGPFAGFVATPQTFDDFAPVSAFMIAPDQRWFAAYTQADARIRIMDMRSGVLLRVLSTAGHKLSGLWILPGNSRIIGAHSEDGLALAWDVATGARLQHDVADGLIARIDHLVDYVTAGDRGKNYVGDGIAAFLKRYKLAEKYPGPDNIDSVIRSADGRYAVILGPKSGEEIVENDKSYRLVNVWDLGRPSAPLVVKIPYDWCGYNVSSFAYDGRYFVFGNHGGEGDHGYIDSAVFEIKDGNAEPLWHAECTTADDASGSISHDDRFYVSSTGPSGPDTVWDLTSGKRAAVFDDVDLTPIISADGSTFAVLKSESGRPALLIVRNGRKRRLDAPVDTGPQGPVIDGALSPNGRYFAATVVDAPSKTRSVGIWDTDSARRIARIQPTDDGGGTWKIGAVSDTGRPLVMRNRSVFISGKWRDVSTTANSLIAPLTPAFRPVCGVIFCDRVMRDLGVVERVLPTDADIRHEWFDLGDFSGLIAGQSPSGRFIHGQSQAIVDVATGRTLLRTDRTGDFSVDGSRLIDGFTLRDISTGKALWTLHETPHGGFVMILADGRVRLSPGAERYIKLVRGFEVKPFDDAARKQFELPHGLAPWLATFGPRARRRSTSPRPDRACGRASPDCRTAIASPATHLAGSATEIASDRRQSR